MNQLENEPSHDEPESPTFRRSQQGKEESNSEDEVKLHKKLADMERRKNQEIDSLNQEVRRPAHYSSTLLFVDSSGCISWRSWRPWWRARFIEKTSWRAPSLAIATCSPSTMCQVSQQPQIRQLHPPVELLNRKRRCRMARLQQDIATKLASYVVINDMTC